MRMPLIVTATCLCLASAIPAQGDIITFQEGVDGYTGTADTSLFQSAPDTNNGFSDGGFLGTVGTVNGENAAAQFLLIFDDLFGDGPGQIPVGSTINSASLSVTQGGSGGFADDVEIFDLTVPFDESTSTWNSLNEGITIGTETDTTATDGPIAIGSSGGVLDVTASLQEWVDDPALNLGWVLVDQTLGFTFSLSLDSAQSATPPTLTVDFIPIPEPGTLALATLGAGLMVMRRRRSV